MTAEESKPPKKPSKLTPLATALIGVGTGVIMIGTAMLAHRIGYPLSETMRSGLELGGLTALLGGVAGARFMPTEPK